MTAVKEPPARVLWVSAETPDRFGQGGQRRQFHQIRELVRRGHRVEVIALAGEQDDRSVREWATVHRLSPSRFRRVPFLRSHRIAERIRTTPCDAVLLSHVESAWMLPTPSRLTAPLAIDVHNVMSHWYAGRGMAAEALRARASEAAAFAAATAILACSERERERLVAVHPGVAHMAFAAPIGIDPAEWPEPDVGTPDPVVAMFGTWSWEPNRLGLEWFAQQVWPLVLEQESHARALVAGSGAEGHDRWPGGMEFVGRVSDLGTFAASAAVVAVPVVDGVGASMKFPEALASGSAVIATPDGANGVADSPAHVSDDPADWAAWIVERLRSRFVAPRPDPARRFALENLTWAVAVDPLDAWLRAMAGAARTTGGFDS